MRLRRRKATLLGELSGNSSVATSLWQIARHAVTAVTRLITGRSIGTRNV
jgi:hypothetical protein